MKKKIAESGDRSSADLMAGSSNLETVLGEESFSALQTHNRLRSLHNLWFLSALPRAQAEIYLELVRPNTLSIHSILSTPYLYTIYTH